MDAPLLFTQIPPEKFAAICQKAEAATGVAISGPQGTAGRDTPIGHVEIEWTYDQNTQQLTIQCLKHPFGFGGTIASKLRNLVEEA